MGVKQGKKMDPNIDCGVKYFIISIVLSIDNFNDFHSDLNSHRAMSCYEWELKARKQFYMKLLERCLSQQQVRIIVRSIAWRNVNYNL